ncbi:MAG: amidohydrolase [Pseudomonadales bacterium]
MTDASPITVFTARSIITMNPSMPRAQAVAVRDGEILEVGTLETLAPWLAAHPHNIDNQFQDAVLTPGFIDPHLHPSMAAVLLPMTFITPTEWTLPWTTVPASQTSAAFDARARTVEAAHGSNDEPLLIWGFHQLWHGPMSRERINGFSTTRPIVVWHRSFHELYMNDAAMAWLDIKPAEIASRPQIDAERGHFFEGGLGFAIRRLNPFILSQERYHEGLERLKEVVHYGGHTTIGDMATGMFDFDMEWQGMKAIIDTDDTPFRTDIIPDAGTMISKLKGEQAAMDFIANLQDQCTPRIRYNDHVKLFADGAFFSQLAQLEPPGYIDGHHGEWLVPPETLEAHARLFWNAGYKIHIHVCGTLGIELALTILEKLQWERPRFNHGFTFEHFGFSQPEQLARIKALGGSVSANVFYLYELSDMYSREGIGYERSSSIARLGSCVREGIPTTVHSDFTMAPAQPLNSAWVAVNRRNSAGDLMCAEERLSVAQALKAITLDAARILGREDEIGSIRSGKKADFTVLASDPLQGDPMDLKDIPILGTIFEGRVFPSA